MSKLWKDNWDEAKEHYRQWWARDGLVIGGHYPPLPPDAEPHTDAPDPGPPPSPEGAYTDPDWRARFNLYRLSRSAFAADCLPVASVDFGPGTLCLALGCEGDFSRRTVWYEPCIEEPPEEHPPLRFDPGQKWWRRQEAVIRANVEMAEGRYYVGCPDLIENYDTLAELRDNEALMMDLVMRPDWVKEKIDEINQAWFAAYDRVYDLIRDDEGGAVFQAFRIWGPGKTAKVQCDAAAMLSPDHFAEFVKPALAEQCDWLDHSLFHLDGSQAIRHLDHLLDIPGLDAIEYTPEPGTPRGPDAAYHDMYRKILEAGKGVQILQSTVPDIEPVFDALGTRGVYLHFAFKTLDEAREAERIAAKYR